MISKVNILKLKPSDYPAVLSQIDEPPKQLYIAGSPLSEWMNSPKVAVVGSRKTSSYGLGVTEKIVGELARAGVVIISGLALGIDAAAHRAALAASGRTVAVLPTSLERIYPSTNQNLARQIVEQGGALISEYSPSEPIFKSNFLNRNRIISGLSDAVLVIEAPYRSGSLATARYGLEQGKAVLAVPGNITSLGSDGCNNLIKSGALPVTGADDVFFALGIKLNKKRAVVFRGTDEEEALYELIIGGVTDQEVLAVKAGLSGAKTGSILTMLELSGSIKPLGAGHWVAS